MRSFVSILASVCIFTALLSGCTQSSGGASANNGGDITVVFIPKVTGNSFFESANDGAQAYAEKNGFHVSYEGSPQAVVDNQISIIKNAIEQKTDAICVSSLDATALDSVMKEALAAGIKVVTWDSDVSGDARMIMVSQGTPDQLGKMLVEMGAKSLTDQGKKPTVDEIRYVWHYSQAFVTDQNSWRVSGEKYISETYPNWINAAPDNYYSEQDPQKSIDIGKTIFTEHPDIDLIICNDSTALPGQAQAAQELGLGADDVVITGFASPNSMRDYCKAGILDRWGLWDCKVQGALGCYIAYYLASGNNISVGDKIDIPDIGIVEVMPNTALDPQAYTAKNSGVVILPSRTEFTINNVDDYDF